MLRSAIQVNVSRAINGHSGAIRLRHPARSAASALPQSNLQKTPTETANELKAFIISNSLNAVPKAIHCHSLKRFCALYPGLDLATVRAAIEGSSILRWNKRSRGQSFVELVPDAVCGPTIRDVVFPKPPSMEDISAALLALRNHISAHYFHLSHVCMSARFVSKFLNSHLGISQYLVSSSMIKTHGESFGLR